MKYQKTNIEKLSNELGIHKGNKRHKKGKPQGRPNTLTRKEKRKAGRKQKKTRKAAFFSRNAKDQKTEEEPIVMPKPKPVKPVKEKPVQIKKKRKLPEPETTKEAMPTKTTPGHDMDIVLERERKQLRQLEKQLKLNKRNRKTLPKSFLDDGLDYLLDACDADKLKLNASEDEESSLSESESDDSVNEGDSAEDTFTSYEPEKKKRKPAKFEEDIAKNKEPEKKKRKTVHFEDEMEEDDDSMEDDSDNASFGDAEDVGDLMGEVKDDEENVDEEDDDFNDDDDNDNDFDKEETGDDDKVREDIYGRLIDKKGNVIQTAGKVQSGAYVPPARRAAMLSQASAETEQLKKQMKGLLNRASEGNMASIANSIEELYMSNSRALMNESLFALVMEAVMGKVLTPERLVAEMALLVAVLHGNVGSEVGAYFLQHCAERFESLRNENEYGGGHTIDNILMLILYLYNFKVAHSVLMFDITNTLVESFTEKDIELLLLLLRVSGFYLRRDDPEGLGNSITAIHNKARALEENGQELPSRMRFMLEVLIAVRNNNVRRVPGADIERTDRLKKVAGTCIRDGGISDNQLKVHLKDLLRADLAGRWWIVGSAWEGHIDQEASEAKSSESSKQPPAFMSGAVSQKLVQLGKKLGMNSDIRRSVFYALMSSEDYEDAFQKVLQISLNEKQQPEIVVVVMTCCKKEKSYNPFYSHFLEKLAKLEKKQGRKFMRMIMTHMWDEFKLLGEMGSEARHNLAMMLAHLLATQALPLDVFKKFEFGALEKSAVKFLRVTLIQLLTSTPLQDLLMIFRSVGRKSGGFSIADGLRVFLKVHMHVKKLEGEQRKTVSERLNAVCDELSFSGQLKL